MAYQNVGTPRFYIDYLSYSRAIGAGGTAKSPNDAGYLDGNLNSLIGLNPTSIVTHTPITAQTLGDIDFTLYDSVENIFETNKMWCGIFGHNFADDDYWWAVGGATDWAWAANVDPIVNTPPVFRTTTDYNGWSLFNCTGLQGSSGDFRLSFYNGAGVDWNVRLGSVGVGKEYTMPHSPDLNLKMSIEMDGVKNIKTRGGTSLANVNYTKPQNWGDMGAWQLEGYPNFRNGRRVWDLSFSYFSDTDVFPINANTSYAATIGSETGYADGDFVINTQGTDVESDDTYEFTSNILDGTDFFSQVWNKTMGGHLPFIFQPDNTNNNPDQFAICRFDMKSLTYKQVANGVYNVKLKIRESW